MNNGQNHIGSSTFRRSPGEIAPSKELDVARVMATGVPDLAQAYGGFRGRTLSSSRQMYAWKEMMEAGINQVIDLRGARYAVAGKTGTSRQIIRVHYDDKGRLIDPYSDEQGRFQTAATFAGFFPADEPKYSIICVLYSVPCRKTYYGGTLPAQIVRDIVNKIDVND